MNDSDKHTSSAADSGIPKVEPKQRDTTQVPSPTRQPTRGKSQRWWIKLIVQPLLVIVGIALLIGGLGVAQQFGLLSTGGGGTSDDAASGDDVKYICPMMCTPPQAEPGRCPVCGMELVPMTKGSSNSDPRAVRIDPAARRVANIQTATVRSAPMTRSIRAIGELSYDESSLRTISAYVPGRLDRLFADYTGVVVAQGDKLALVYSPRLYSSQVEFLLAKKALDGSRSSTLARVRESNGELLESARQRLTELGMTDSQIEQLEESGKADSRLHLLAPTSGTVIEKLAVEGEYVKEGQMIYRLADLSTVWLMLELFPEDAAQVRDGQQVQAEVQSLPGESFAGRVAFIDPQVDPKTRTVGVRVVMENPEGLLRIGDFAKAKIEVALESIAGDAALVIPRNALLSAGSNSVVYVETEPGRFELRQVVLGSTSGEKVVVHSGLKSGEQVATHGNFLIDSQMQLAGNPSLIDPTKALPNVDEELSKEMLASLSPGDQALVIEQRICPVTDLLLGSMGTPKRVDVNGETVFICCEGCRVSLLKEPAKYRAKLNDDNPLRDSKQAEPGQGLPPIGEIKPIEPQSGLPPIEKPRAISSPNDSRGSMTPAAELAPEVTR